MQMVNELTEIIKKYISQTLLVTNGIVSEYNANSRRDAEFIEKIYLDYGADTNKESTDCIVETFYRQANIELMSYTAERVFADKDTYLLLPSGDIKLNKSCDEDAVKCTISFYYPKRDLNIHIICGKKFSKPLFFYDLIPSIDDDGKLCFSLDMYRTI